VIEWDAIITEDRLNERIGWRSAPDAGIRSLGAVFGIFAGFYYWTGKMSGRHYLEFWGKAHFWVLFVSANVTFFPMHFLGAQGMPRRYPDYPDAY
jgi:cytochrome c oxidase subunit 1